VGSSGGAGGDDPDGPHSPSIEHYRPVRNEVAAALSRRELVFRGGALGLGAAIAAALPAAIRLGAAVPAFAADPDLADGTLQAYWDTIIPGRKATTTDLGNPIHPQAIAGVDADPGAVEADALLLSKNARTGFSTLAPAFLADLEARSLPQGGAFLDLDYETRQAVLVRALSFDNLALERLIVFEAAAAIAFTAFCAAATQRGATWHTASGYRVMGFPGPAPNGYRSFSYRRKLSRERTDRGYLP
jgi:hypothetical protein